MTTIAANPLERLAEGLAGDLEQVNVLIRARMASENAPRIPEVTAHLSTVAEAKSIDNKTGPVI